MILDQAELKRLTGFTRRAEQRKELEHLKIPYKERRDGSLVVTWDDVRVTSSAQPEPELHL